LLLLSFLTCAACASSVYGPSTNWTQTYKAAGCVHHVSTVVDCCMYVTCWCLVCCHRESGNWWHNGHRQATLKSDSTGAVQVWHHGVYLNWLTNGQHCSGVASDICDRLAVAGNTGNWRQVTSSSQLRDVEWTTHTCTLSFTVCGSSLALTVFVSLLRTFRFLFQGYIENRRPRF